MAVHMHCGCAYGVQTATIRILSWSNRTWEITSSVAAGVLVVHVGCAQQRWSHAKVLTFGWITRRGLLLGCRTARLLDKGHDSRTSEAW